MGNSLKLLEKNFFPLFCDAAWFAEHSSPFVNAKNSNCRRFSKVSILYSALCLEAVANCCLDALPPLGQTSVAIEKLDALGKLHVYALFKGRKFERGDCFVQPMVELKKLRDSYVHPKVMAHPAEFVPAASDGYFSILRVDSNHKELPFLKITTNPNEWDWNCAKKVLNKLSNFLNHFFIKICGNKRKETEEVLFLNLAGGSKAVLPLEWPEAVLRLSKEGVIDLSFVQRQKRKSKGPSRDS